jgi:NitT/TauT family transport system substrate-binding protein
MMRLSGKLNRTARLQPITGALVLIVLCLSGTGSTADLRIMTAGSGPATFVIRLPQALGFYKREGLDVEIMSVAGGSRAIQILLSRQVDIITTGLMAVVQANTSGANLRVLATAHGKIPYVFMSQPHITTRSELRGGYVSISTFGSEPDIMTTFALRELGLTRKDVVIVQMGQNSLRLASLLAGHSSATLLSEPNVSVARRKGFNVLVDFRSLKIPWVSTGIVTTAAMLRDNGDNIKRMLRAAYTAGRYAENNQRQIKDIIATEFKLDDPKLIDAIYDDFINSSRVAAVSRESGQFVLNEMRATGLNVGDGKIEEHINDTLIREVRREAQ